MKRSRLVQWLVVVKLLTIILDVVAAFIIEPKVPYLLKAYIDYETASSETLTTFQLFVFLPIHFIHIIALLGLLSMKPWAGIIIVPVIFISYFHKPYLESGASYTLSMVSVFVSGMILALLVTKNPAKTNTALLS